MFHSLRVTIITKVRDFFFTVRKPSKSSLRIAFDRLSTRVPTVFELYIEFFLSILVFTVQPVQILVGAVLGYILKGLWVYFFSALPLLYSSFFFVHWFILQLYVLACKFRSPYLFFKGLNFGYLGVFSFYAAFLVSQPWGADEIFKLLFVLFFVFPSLHIGLEIKDYLFNQRVKVFVFVLFFLLVSRVFFELPFCTVPYPYINVYLGSLKDVQPLYLDYLHAYFDYEVLMPQSELNAREVELERLVDLGKQADEDRFAKRNYPDLRAWFFANGRWQKYDEGHIRTMEYLRKQRVT
jgi:hypothetical protein